MPTDDLSPADRASRLIDRHRSTSSRRRLVTTVVVVVAAAAAVFGAQHALRADGGPSEAQYATPANATEDFGFRLTPTVATSEKQTEPDVTVALYEDFLCPACGTFEERSGTFLKDAVEEGRIVLEYRPFTFLVGASSNRYAERASNAAACVADTGGVESFVAFHDKLFAEQPREGGDGPEDDALTTWALDAGAPDEVEQCIRDERFADWLAAALVEGRDRGIRATPAVTVDGSLLEVAGDDGDTSIPDPEDLERALARSGA